MQRRALLSLAGLAFAGCLGGDPDDPGTPTEQPQQVGWPEDPSIFDTIEVGSRDAVAFPENNRPEFVFVWNDGPERDVGVHVDREGSVALDRSISFPVDGVLELLLNEPDDYTVTVSQGDGSVHFDVESRQFDCNRRENRITVGPGGAGSMVLHGSSTEIGCPPPSVTRTDFAARAGECDAGRGDSTSVSYAGVSIAIDGSLRVPTPCHGAELAEATYDRETDTLTVVVAVTDPPGDAACVQCVGVVDYDASVTFADDLPGRVEVVHRGAGDERTVTAAAR